jgi:hypothetical protein
MFMEIGIRQFFDSQSLVKCASKLLFGLPCSRRYILISAFQIVHGDIRILHLIAKLQILFERSQMTYTLGSADNTMCCQVNTPWFKLAEFIWARKRDSLCPTSASETVSYVPATTSPQESSQLAFIPV